MLRGPPLRAPRSHQEPHGIGSCYVYVSDADALHAELTARGANVQGEPVSRPWGLREFPVLDPEGNRITFAQPLEQAFPINHTQHANGSARPL